MILLNLEPVRNKEALQSFNCKAFWDTKYKIRTYDPIRVKDVLYH